MKTEISSLIHNRDVAFDLTREVLTVNMELRTEVAQLKEELRILHELYAAEKGVLTKNVEMHKEIEKLKHMVHMFPAMKNRWLARIDVLRQCISELGDKMPRCECVDAHGWANQYLEADSKTAKEHESDYWTDR